MITTGLDLSLTATGLACIKDGQLRRLKTLGWPGEDGETWEQRNDRVVALTSLILGQIPSDTTLTVIEGPAYQSVTGHAFDRARLWGGVYAGIRRRGIPIAVCAPNTLKLFATGYGHATKTDVVNAVAGRWPRTLVRDDNQADAIALAEAGAVLLDAPLPFEITARHRTNLKAVARPATLTPGGSNGT